MAVAPSDFKRRERISLILFAPFAINEKGVVPMIFRLHLRFTYDNYGRYFSDSNCNSNRRVCSQTQIKEKDNRPALTVRLSF